MRIIVSVTVSILVCDFAYAQDPSESNLNKARALTQPRERPSMFVSAEPIEGLRTVEDMRAGIQSGHAKNLWDELVERVDAGLSDPVVTPYQMRDGERVLGNRSYGLVARAANRILDTALVGMLTEDQRYVDGALAQIMALFDESQWPEWSDQAHLNVGLNADLRHGQLVMPIAVAYDWLYPQLTEAQRAAIIEGIERCAIEPYKAGIEANEHWSRRRSNWMTVVLGGFGIAGMALGPDHPESAMLVANSINQMESYLDILGPEGEFNESVQYAGSMSYVVRYFMAMRYASGGEDNPFERHSLDDFYRWYMHMTFPPGRVAGFGDPAPDMPPVVVPAAAVAAATRDPLLQWFYEQYYDEMLDTHRKRALELIYYDAGLESKSPRGAMPLARGYSAQGALISSRSSWDADSAVSVVYGKAGREAYHGHADWGQLCIDGYGDRLVVDLGSPPGYPKGQYEYYYNYQQFGHNVFVFGENETGGVSWREKDRNGDYIYTITGDPRGAAWSINLNGVYGDGIRATRTVVHVLPRVAIVLDEAALDLEQKFSMRWHLGGDATINGDGSFRTVTEMAVLAGRSMRLDGDATVREATHRYEPPYDKGRLGDPLKQRNEPYIELTATDSHCKILTLFAVFEAGMDTVQWTGNGDGWGIETPEGAVRVQYVSGGISVLIPGAEAWTLPAGIKEGE